MPHGALTSKIKFIPLIKCKLSAASTKMSDIYNFFSFFFDFINKIILQQKAAPSDDESKEFDPLSWNLSNGKKAKQQQRPAEKRKLRNKNK